MMKLSGCCSGKQQIMQEQVGRYYTSLRIFGREKVYTHKSWIVELLSIDQVLFKCFGIKINPAELASYLGSISCTV